MQVREPITDHACTICGFVYNEESALRDIEDHPIPFENVPEDFMCPNCGATPKVFLPINEGEETFVPKPPKK